MQLDFCPFLFISHVKIAKNGQKVAGFAQTAIAIENNLPKRLWSGQAVLRFNGMRCISVPVAIQKVQLAK
jgi:hypothetical protein